MTTGNLTTEQDYQLGCNVCGDVQTVRVCTVRKDQYVVVITCVRTAGVLYLRRRNNGYTYDFSRVV